jgi:hypothetical protein
VGQNLAGRLFLRVWQMGGVLVYMPVADITREAVLAAAAATAAAAASAAASGGGAATATATGPRWSLEISKLTAAIIAGAAALAAAIAAIFKPARVVTLLGQLLGMLARWLGFGLTLGAGALAHAAGSGGGAGGAGTTVPVPTDVPGPRTDDPTHGKGTRPAPGAKRSTEKSGGRVTPPKGRHVKLDLIEGVSLQDLSRGMVVPVQISDLKSRHGVALLQVTKVTRDGEETTVEFKALQSQMSAVGQPSEQSNLGNDVYTVTHPHRDLDLKLVGQVVKMGSDPLWFANYLENVANKLEAEGRKPEADEVRSEVRRLRSAAKRTKP